MKLCVCLEMVFTDLPYSKRIEKIAEAGYDLAEFWFHDWTAGDTPDLSGPKDPATLKQVCERTGVAINNMVVNGPTGKPGGAPVDSRDLGQYLERLHEVIEFAKSIGVGRAITCSGDLVDGLSRAQMRSNLEKALCEGAAVAAENDFTLLIEPLNTLVDHAGYYLDSSREAIEIIRAIDSPRLKLVYDCYHMQIMEGNILSTITANIDIIGHFHSAGVPGRHDLTHGELNYREITKCINAMGYTGAFGLEYSPAGPDHLASLREIKEYLA
jgi:hydroxypyruvate isomerase